MSAFKDIVKNDLKTVFFNVEEFAEERRINYDGVEYSAPVIIDTDTLQDRKKTASDHEAELARHEVTIYIMAESLPVQPRKNHYISVDDREYLIVQNNERPGLHELICEELEE